MKALTVWYSVLHMLVDGVCALAMFGRFLSWEDGRLYLLIYNFCAFALQMPIGALLDILCMESRKKLRLRQERQVSMLVAVAGVLCTIAGAITHPAVLGLGNALFHVGGGVGTIYEDREKKWNGRGLGVFVAPGALGLYLGMLFAKDGAGSTWLWGACILMILICAGMLHMQKRSRRWKTNLAGDGCGQKSIFAGQGEDQVMSRAGQRDKLMSRHAAQAKKEVVPGQKGFAQKVWLAVCCFVVVVLRSYIGMTVDFRWKTTLVAGLLSIFAIVGGKMAGGFCGARYGYRKTALVSLLAAAACYLFSVFLPMGVAALFLFNMTMPITLYLMICEFPQMPGFAFGCLTFALFLGFLPEYFALPPLMGSAAVGGIALENTVMPSLGSMLSLLLIFAAIKGSRQRSPERREV